MEDYCENCNKMIEQIEIEEGVFGCPICKRDDKIITFYEAEED